jgi:hypothetical protein
LRLSKGCANVGTVKKARGCRSKEQEKTKGEEGQEQDDDRSLTPVTKKVQQCH